MTGMGCLCAALPGLLVASGLISVPPQAWPLSFVAAAVCERGKLGAASAASCVAWVAEVGRRLDLVPSLTGSSAGMALLLRICSALILSTLAVAVGAAAVVALEALLAAVVTLWPFSDGDVVRTPTPT